MDPSFCLGECVWYTRMMLWLIFGGSTLGIYGVMRIAKSDTTVHKCAPVRTDRTVHRLCTDGHVTLAATLVASIFMDWASILLIIVPHC
jgi:hypothetical protein